MVRMLLYVALGIILWRIFRVATRMMQGPRNRGGEDPSGSRRHPQRKTDLKDVQDAEFEDITEKKEPPNPPAGQ